jgi:DNA polymerase-3 subunit beta
MKFSINRTLLINILGDYLPILREHPVKPVIAGVLIQAAGDEVIFTGTNLEVNLIKRIPAKVYQEGETAFIPNLVLEYIKLLDEEEVTVSMENNRLFIENADFVVLESEEFPIVNELSNELVTEIDGDMFIQYLEKVKFSSAITNDNLALACVRLVFKEEEINFVSTDSYRLTFARKHHFCEKNLEVSLPIETVNVLCKLFKGINQDVSISIVENTLIFRWANSYFSSRIIELPFPNYQGILGNHNFQKVMEFNSSEFKSALKKVITVARTNMDTKFGALFDFKGNTLVISSVGKAKISQKVAMLKEGDNFKASLNTKYLSEFVEKLSKNIVIKGNSSSAMFDIREIKDDDYIYILMPLALRD